MRKSSLPVLEFSQRGCSPFHRRFKASSWVEKRIRMTSRRRPSDSVVYSQICVRLLGLFYPILLFITRQVRLWIPVYVVNAAQTLHNNLFLLPTVRSFIYRYWLLTHRNETKIHVHQILLYRTAAEIRC